jgi:hypothetical protein
MWMLLILLLSFKFVCLNSFNWFFLSYRSTLSSPLICWWIFTHFSFVSMLHILIWMVLLHFLVFMMVMEVRFENIIPIELMPECHFYYCYELQMSASALKWMLRTLDNDFWGSFMLMLLYLWSFMIELVKYFVTKGVLCMLT